MPGSVESSKEAGVAGRKTAYNGLEKSTMEKQVRKEVQTARPMLSYTL